MPRIPLLPADLAEPAEIVDAVRARRGGALLTLDRLLLHSPAFTRGWNAFLKEVRGNLSLAPKRREMLMTAVAVLNRAPFEIKAHLPLFRKEGGTKAEAEALARIGEADFDPGAFEPVERDLLALAQQMSRGAGVDAGLVAGLRAALSDRGTVEAIGLIACFIMVTRFMMAVDLEGG